MRAIDVPAEFVRDSLTSQASLSSEEMLACRARTDPEAFGQLCENYYGWILSYTFRCTFVVELAEELTSNTFFKALRGIGKYRSSGSFGAWLYRIATNEVRMYWRSERRRREDQALRKDELSRIYFDLLASETPEQVEQKMQAFASVRGAILELADRYRVPLLLRFFEGMSYEQIADVLGKRPGTVKSLIHRGLRGLQGLLERKGITSHS